jgi:release factor glutamine methyltransferase
MVIGGKPYSTIPSAADELFTISSGSVHFEPDHARIDTAGLSGRALILDEGGGLHDRLPLEVAPSAAGVEQTSAGNRPQWKYPCVLVCRSAAKLAFESQIIARAIVRKLDSLGLLRREITPGIIGLGALGTELANLLVERGFRVLGYDAGAARRGHRAVVVTLPQLLNDSALILGVTGSDCLKGADLHALRGRKTFASCSSSDVEFASILPHLARHGRFGKATGTLGAATISVLNGGHPINFDREREWELPEEIALTRRLCLQGLLQAEPLIGSRPRGVMLDPAVQLRLVEAWLERVPGRETLRVPPKLDEAFFKMGSEGEHLMSGKPVYTLHSTTPGALDRMRAHSSPYNTQVCGLDVLVLPGVWSPAYDWSSAFYVENCPDLEGLSFLEIGSGTGVISVHAGLRGAAKVVASDVNPEAVRNTQLNFERHGLSNGEVVLSDGFERITGRFDVIVWNAPYHGSHPSDLLERGCADEDYRGIRAFFGGVAHHLHPGGTIVFGFSESGDLPLIRSLIAQAGFRIKRELSDWREGYNCMLFELSAGSSVTEPGAPPVSIMKNHD